MASTRASGIPTPESQLRVDVSTATQKISDRIGLGDEIRQRRITTAEQLQASDNEFSRWNAYNVELLNRLFTSPKFADEYSYWAPVAVRMYEESPAEKLEDLQRRVGQKIHRLESIRERLELVPVATNTLSGAGPTTREHTNRVFVVHGHDEAARESVARFLEKLGLTAVVLHEQATEGRTIVEKLEHYADVDFAVVLLTPDDVGGSKSTVPEKLNPRARQNVILELGLFVGKLGRKNVCPLYKDSLELPSDYLGVGYVPLDEAGGWRLQLAKELRSAGFAVDMNLAI